MIATDVLPTSFWDDVGLRRYETFADERHLIIYGQRTADNRIAFGGRGAPYHFGSSVEPRFDANERVFSLLEGTLHELFPSLDAPITHRWGGPLAMPRNHAPFVEVDHAAGLARAGGYTGDGVVLSFVAARALAEQILDRAADSELSRLPFVQVPPRRWETEPWRYLGINAGLALASHVDNVERRGGRAARAEGLLARLMS
jgi:glycine/D-amino acid oxidase-like deaminating enzyme